MNVSDEQKEILNLIHAFTARGNSQPSTIKFTDVISRLSPENCYMQYGKKLSGFRFSIYNDEYKDEKQLDKLNGDVITSLFLLDLLAEESLIIAFDLKEGFDHQKNIVFLADKEGNDPMLNPQLKSLNKKVSPTLNSPSVWKMLDKYANTVIQPSYSLIKFVENDFKSDEQVLNEQNLETAVSALDDGKVALQNSRESIKYALVAIGIALLFGIWAITLNYKANSIAKEELEIDKQELVIDSASLHYTELSSSEKEQFNTNNLIESNNLRLDRLNSTMDSVLLELKKMQPIKIKKKGKK